METWVVNIDFQDGGGNTDISALVEVESFTRVRTLHKDMKPTTDGCSFLMHVDSDVVVNKFLSQGYDEILVSITKNGSDYFTGIVWDTYEATIGQIVEGLKIECVDYSVRLDKKMKFTAQWQNYDVIDTATPAESIVHQLIVESGGAVGDLDVTSIAKTIDWYMVDGRTERRTYRQAITDVLFEFGYVWYFDVDGKFHISELFPSSVASTHTFDGDDLIGRLRIKRERRRYEGTRIQWSPHVVESSVIVFSEVGGGGGENQCDIEIVAGDYYPDGSDGTDKVYAQYEYAGYEIVNVASASLEWNGQAGLVASRFTSTGREADVAINNPTGGTLHLYKLDVRGTVTYVDTINVQVAERVVDTQFVWEWKARFITAEADASFLSDAASQYFLNGLMGYRFRSKVDIEPGAIVTVQDPQLSSDNLVRVLRVVDLNPDRTDEHEYFAVGLAAYSAESTTIEGSRISMPGARLQEEVDNRPTYDQAIQDGWDDGTAGTTTPTVPTISVCQGHFKAVRIEWDRQANLTNFSRYEIQVSDDQSTWYSLEMDLTDWKDTAWADTDWPGEFLVQPVPNDETDPDDPSGYTLYYRVRRVTKTGTSSAYSTAASATSKTIEDGDLAANSIYANNIKVSQITAREMSFADDGGTPVYEDFDPLPLSGCEYWDLRQPDCKSHLNRSPESGYLTCFFPGHLYDEIKAEYNNAWAKFTGLGTIGVFKATENLVADPEDLTTGNWTYNAGGSGSLLETSFGQHRFSRVTSNGADSGRGEYQTIGTINATVVSIRMILKHADSQKSGFGLYKSTAAAAYIANVSVNWSTKAITFVVGSGTIVSADWYESDSIVEVSVIITGLTSGHSYDLYIQPTYNIAEAKSCDYTAIQVEDSTYPTPYTPTERDDGALVSTKDMPNAGTIECWVRPWFDAGTTEYHHVLCWGDDLDNRLFLWYDHPTNKWRVYWRNTAGTGRDLYGTTVYTNTTLWTWIHLKITWNISAGTGALIVNGVTEDSTWSGALDAFTTPISTLGIGCRGYSTALHFDGLITDFLFKDSVDTSTAHYTLAKPYYDPDEIANQYQSVRINKSGIRMTGGAGLTMTDDLNRLIDVSNASGMLARDAGGKIIHDIPDAPVQVGNLYLGHDLWNDDLASYKIYDSSSFPSATFTDVTCLANGNRNVKKGIFKIRIYGIGAAITTPHVWVVLRPKGSSWGTLPASNTPGEYTRMQFTGSYCIRIDRMLYIECPIGDDNKIQFYGTVAPSSTNAGLMITQLGLGI